MDRNDTLKKAGLAAVIILAPGGLILGAALAARYWRARGSAEGAVRAQDVAENPDRDEKPS